MSATFRIGILNDMSAGPPGPSDLHDWLKLVVAEFQAHGRLTCDIEFIDAWGLGLPAGSADNVERAYRELAEQKVGLIIGPAIGDNALVAAPLALQFKIPTINWAGSELARNEYMFQLQVGSHQEEPWLMAEYLANQGKTRLAVIYDASPIGEGYREALEAATRVHGLEIVFSTSIDVLAEEAESQVAAISRHQVESCVYLGLGHSVVALAQELKRIHWQGLRMMTSAGIRGYFGDFCQHIDSWVYVDLWHEGNDTLNQLLLRHRIPRERSLAAAKGYDLARLVLQGVMNAKGNRCHDIKAGLEAIKWLPAAEGENGTLLGFGRYDRGALHGRYLVLRQWLQGQSVRVNTQQNTAVSAQQQ